jgi:hypothetical protein
MILKKWIYLDTLSIYNLFNIRFQSFLKGSINNRK